MLPVRAVSVRIQVATMSVEQFTLTTVTKEKFGSTGVLIVWSDKVCVSYVSGALMEKRKQNYFSSRGTGGGAILPTQYIYTHIVCT